MLKHLFKMIWNKKKQNFLLISEMLVSFLVIFAVFTLLVYYYQNYKKPMGIDYEDVWVVNFQNPLKTNNSDSLMQYYQTLRQTIKSLPQVKEISFTSENVPFSMNTSQGGFTYNGKLFDHINWYQAEDGYKDVLNMKVLEGRWFEKQDAVSKDRPVIINNSLKEKLFGSGTATGRFIGDDNQKKYLMKVIGVVEDVKAKGDYAIPGIALYKRIDTSLYNDLSRIMIKVEHDANAAFEGRLYKTMANFMKDANIEIEHLSN